MQKKTIEEFQKEIKKNIKNLTNKFDNRRYSKYIKDKNAIIVGPDPRMKNTELGTQIEKNFQVIIRLNTTFNYVPFKKELAQDIGFRTDVIYFCPSSMRETTKRGTLLKDGKQKQKFTQQLDKAKVKFINYQNGNRNGKYMTGDYVYKPEITSMKKFLIGNKKIRTQLNYSHESCQILSNLMGKCLELIRSAYKDSNNKGNDSKLDGYQEILKTPHHVPRTGFLAIFDCLVHGAKSVTIEGMSFYHGGGHMFRKNATGDLDPTKNHANQDSHHNSLLEVYLLKILIDMYPKKIIIQSKYLKQILDGIQL